MCSDFMDCRRCSPTVMVYTYLRIMTLLTDVIMSVETKPRCIFHQGCLKLVIFVNVFIKGRMKPYQLLEYQTDMRRCRFDTLGKQTFAHRAGGPTPYTGLVPPARWVSAAAASPGPPTVRAGWQPARAVGGPLSGLKSIRRSPLEL